MLSGLVVHELLWADTLARLIQFRRHIKDAFGLNMTEEIHAGAMISRAGGKLGKNASELKKHLRLAIIRHFADALARIEDISVINVVCDKFHRHSKDEIFELTWKAMFQRFENTLRYGNFPGPRRSDERGIIFADNTDGTKLRTYLRKMRRYNPVPNRYTGGTRNIPVKMLIEDPNLRDSQHSYFIQAVDCVAFLLKQFVIPNGYMKKKGGNAYFKRLEPILCKVAAPRDPYGVVRI